MKRVRAAETCLPSVLCDGLVIQLYSRAWRNNGQRSGHADVLLCFKMTNQDVCSQPMFISQKELVQIDMWLTAEIVWAVLHAVKCSKSYFPISRKSILGFYCDMVWQIPSFKTIRSKRFTSATQGKTSSWLLLLTLTVNLSLYLSFRYDAKTRSLLAKKWKQGRKQLAWLCPKVKKTTTF